MFVGFFKREKGFNKLTGNQNVQQYTDMIELYCEFIRTKQKLACLKMKNINSKFQIEVKIVVENSGNPCSGRSRTLLYWLLTIILNEESFYIDCVKKVLKFTIIFGISGGGTSPTSSLDTFLNTMDAQYSNFSTKPEAKHLHWNESNKSLP